MSGEFGFVRVENGREVCGFLENKTFTSVEEAAAWLRDSAWGIWGLGRVEVSEAGEKVVRFAHVAEAGVEVVARRLTEEERREADRVVAGIRKQLSFQGSLVVGGRVLNVYLGDGEED